MTWLFRLSLLGFASAAGGAAEEATAPHYTIQRTSGEVIIDGVLGEPDWKAARGVGAFRFPWWTSGAREQTEAKLLWDENNLYVSFDCQDAHIWGEHTERDSPVYRDDCVEVFTAPNPEQPDNYFNIEMNVRGAFLDQHRPQGPGGEVKADWNPTGIRIAVTVHGTLNNDSDTDRGWTLEAAIPLATFAGVAKSVPPTSGQVWHLNLNRLGGMTNPQHSQWSPSQTARPSFHVPANFGRATFAASRAVDNGP